MAEKKKKVCFLNGHLILREHKTGVHYFHEIVTKKIAEKKRDYDILVAYFQNSESENAIKKYRNKWIEQYCVVSSKWKRIFSYLFPIEWFFGKNDVYFCDGLFPIVLGKSKRICLVHDLMVKIYPENYSFVKKMYLNMFFNKLPKADLVVCVSENTKKDIIKYYDVNPDKIIVCYNGINKENSLIKNDKLDDNSITLSNRFLFYLGDMRKNKNVVSTVKGFLHFCENNSIDDLFFYIAGKKNEEYQNVLEVTQNSKHGNQVVFLGYISDNDRELLYKNCEAVVLLSLYEGFGMPIVEGMGHYKPVITSNCSSMKEVGEDAAVLADPQNVEDISRAIGDVYYQRFKVDKEKYDKKLSIYNFDNVASIIDGAIESIMD